MEALTPYKPSPLLYGTLALLLATLACAAFATGGPSTPSAISELVANGPIAYLGTDGNLYTIGENGGNNFPITQDAQLRPPLRIYQHPTWSPDGRHLAFVAIESNGGDQTHQLLVFTPETGETTEIFSDEAESPFYLYWSPESERVSFLTSAPNTPHLFLRLAFLNGDESKVIDTGQPYYWVWSPDGQTIFVHEGGAMVVNPAARLSLLSPDDGQMQTFELAPANFQAPAWSPDGESLLVSIVREEQTILSLLDRDGAPTQTLGEFNHTIAFNWSPNGEQIAYRATTLESGGFFGPLNVIAANDPESRQTTTEEAVLAYFWAPDSQKIAYFTPDMSGDIDAVVRTQAQDTFSLSLNVMDVQTGSSRRLATLQPTAEFLNIIPFFDQYHHSATIWSPDSTQLVYTTVSGDNDASVWVVQADGGMPVHIADGTLAFWSWK